MTIAPSTAPASGTTEVPGATADTEAPGIDGIDEGPEQPRREPVRFEDSVVLSKREVFGACQALADADRVLLRCGGTSEASVLGDLFELLEGRLSG